MPGEMLFQVADLSRVWVIAEVAEQDLPHVSVGAMATVTLNAYPQRSVSGQITYIYPTVKAETRTVQLRVELANPGFLLKPGMFAQMDIAAAPVRPVLAVPLSAVIDSGLRSVVLLQLDEGRFEAREVKLGLRNDTHVQVTQGLQGGEQVVVAANFLIDAESNLRAALGGMAPSTPAPASSAPQRGGHHARGVVESVDTKALSATLRHEPVASLKWPAMTMEFKVSNAAVLEALRAGQAVDFEFVERQPGEWVITRASAPQPTQH